MAITIKDVAKKAGVATSTVSRTIKDSPSISPETKEKVRKAMEKLGYTPNFSAQSLASKTTKTIGVILPPFNSTERTNNPFFLEILHAISQACNQKSYIVSLAAGDSTEELLDSVRLMHLHKRIDGFIILYSINKDPVIHYIHDNHIPYVMIGKPHEFENETMYVDNDNFLSGKTATNYLIRFGHQKIAYVGMENNEIVNQERYFGYQMAMNQSNLKTEPFFNIENDEGYLEFVNYLKKERPTALIAVDDIFALSLFQILSSLGLSVPDDISLISFNNSMLLTVNHPYLTTVDIHVNDLGKQAVFKLVDKLSGDGSPTPNLIIPHTIIERETVKNIQ